MKYLQKTWVRIIFSLLGGSIISEIVHVSTGDPNRPRTDSGSLIVFGAAIIIYFILTDLLKK